MKTKLPLLVTLAVMGSTASIAQAGQSDAAYTACKAHISEVTDGASKTTLRKIKKRKGQHQVRVKVRADGEKFNALCIVSADGSLTYQSDQNQEIVAKNT